jgi:hypothetical protein
MTEPRTRTRSGRRMIRAAAAPLLLAQAAACAALPASYGAPHADDAHHAAAHQSHASHAAVREETSAHEGHEAHGAAREASSAHESHEAHGAGHGAHHGHGGDQGEHPQPRADRQHAVLPPSHFAAHPEVARVYEMAAEIPQVLDGIHCHCNCNVHRGHYSLLSCFEEEHGSMCGACMNEVKLAHRRTAEGATLDQVRAEIDSTFGP